MQPPDAPPADILWLVLDAAVDLFLDWPDVKISGRWSDITLRRRMLCACALTCKVMLVRARFHLYANVTLYDPSQATAFVRTMTECEDLALAPHNPPLQICV